MNVVSQPGQYAPFSLCFDYGSLIIFSNLLLGARFKVADVSLHSGRRGFDSKGREAKKSYVRNNKTFPLKH